MNERRWSGAGFAISVCLLTATAGAPACKKTTAKTESSARAGGRGGAGKGGSAGLKYPVEVYPVESRRVAYTVTAPGTIAAFERVQVTARVSGAVDRIAFTEGQEVKKGDVLVVIDSARYQSAVNSARALLEKAKASEKDAAAMIARRQNASTEHPGLIPGEELATYETKDSMAKADTLVAEEAVRAAELNLRDSAVRAPMDGVVQTRTVETGQYVQAGYLMATLLRADPMLLRFDVAPLDAPRVKPGMIADFKLRETQRVFHAKITLVAGSASDDSHMVGVTAEVQNDEHKYWLRPGSFADVTLDCGGTRDAVVIPRDAVRPTERGFVAYVVDGGKAEERVLVLGANTKDGWVEVRDGLKAGDKLVTRGAEPLSNGAAVDVTEVAPPVSSAFVAPGASVNPPSPPPDTSTSASPSPTTAPARKGSRGGRP
jgi:RND family efflux transporter MFP subunit